MNKETIKAAEEYVDYSKSTTYKKERTAFLAGAEYKQQQIDELHDALDGAKYIILRLIAGKRVVGLDESIGHYEHLIQKHRP